MGAIGGEDLKKWEKMQGAALGGEEKILVLVRLRPLSEKEIMRNKVSYWGCINETTILYRNILPERSRLPIAYTFGYIKVIIQQGKCMREEQRRLLFLLSAESTTIESSAYEFIGKVNKTTLSASVNFIDLAKSERASQALSVGQRLKEDCHINLSLLTLGIVIRKLSNGIHGNINYRDSKLTRILQPALGGNAKIAIIFTLSTARSHVEQS
ncbi:Kinesin-like protein NACK2 [Capsicum chinense]|nr:Kinesin-like protein NACK2 [Capsicum chinense]